MTTSLEGTCAKTVARQLKQTCRKLAVTEANVEFFSDMAKNVMQLYSNMYIANGKR